MSIYVSVYCLCICVSLLACCMFMCLCIPVSLVEKHYICISAREHVCAHMCRCVIVCMYAICTVSSLSKACLKCCGGEGLSTESHHSFLIYPLTPFYWKCGPWTNETSLSWELGGNAEKERKKGGAIEEVQSVPPKP